MSALLLVIHEGVNANAFKMAVVQFNYSYFFSIVNLLFFFLENITNILIQRGDVSENDTRYYNKLKRN